MPYQTFSLDADARLLIRESLLDRFLACMKPASITQRQPSAGVFFWPEGIDGDDSYGHGFMTLANAALVAAMQQSEGEKS